MRGEVLAPNDWRRGKMCASKRPKRFKEVSTDVQVQIGSEVRLVTERIAGFNGVLSVRKSPSSQQIESKSRIF